MQEFVAVVPKLIDGNENKNKQTNENKMKTKQKKQLNKYVSFITTGNILH